MSHQAAGAIHVFDTFFPGPLAFLVAHGAHRRLPGVAVHQTRDPWALSVEVKRGFVVTSPARTFCDLAATTSMARLRDAIDDAEVRKLVTGREMRREYEALVRRGKRGFATLGSILDERAPGEPPPNGKLERRTLDMFDRFGGPKPKVCWE